MKYKVTGGPEGDLGIEIEGKRYEAGDVVELTGKKNEWLVEQGIVEPLAKNTAEKKESVKKVSE